MLIAFIISLIFVFTLSLTIHAQSPILCTTPRPRPRRVRPCGQFCTFRLCNTNGTIRQLPEAPYTLLGAPGTATSPFVCNSADDVFQVKTGEARVYTEDHQLGDLYIPISLWRPASLSHSFSSDFMTAFKMSHLDFFGIGRLPTFGNQWDFLHDRCMILPIEKYRTMPGSGGRTIDSTGDPRACVAFRTTAPTLHAEVIWDSQDDFDLGIVEPDGSIIDRFCPRSNAGKLNGDNNEGFCNTALTAGKENIVFLPGGPVQRGRYEVFVQHTKSCSRRFTTMILRIMKRGVVIFEQDKRVSRDPAATKSGDVLTKRFTF